MKILVILGSDSDLKRMESCFATLKELDVDYDLELCSAHRTPGRARELAEGAEGKYDVIIAAAGLAAHLPGVIAAYTLVPVIGVPLAAGALNGVDALYSIVQMPPGVPVASVGIDGGRNAAVLACELLGMKDESYREKLRAYRARRAEQLMAKNAALKADK